MAQDNALAQARALVDELLEAAKTGAIVPVRLPGEEFTGLIRTGTIGEG